MSTAIGLASLYPETLLDDPGADQGMISERRWWVAYTKVHQEKALAEQLCGYGIPYYLPLVAKIAICHGRRFIRRVPVFSSYLFLFGTEQERVTALTTNRICQTLHVHDAERLSSDLRQLRCLIEQGVALTVESRLVSGARVRVRRGPLAGLEGTVLKRRGMTRLLVAVNFLQQGASAEIEDFLLEPVD
jgi:transcriptional antiterminator RfaH